MEYKPKDINQIYREMEEAVAQKVRETMEFADAKRRALAQEKIVTNQKEVMINVYQTKGTEPEVIQTNRVIVTTSGISLQGAEDNNHSTYQTNNELVEAVKQETQNDKQHTHENVETILSNVSKASEESNTFFKTEPSIEIGFEQFKVGETEKEGDWSNSGAAQMDWGAQNTVEAEKTKNVQIGFEPFGEQSVPSDVYQPKIYQSMENRLTNSDNVTQENNENKRRIAAEALTLAQNAVRNNNNNPFEIVEENSENLKEIGEKALAVAESAVSYSKNPFESVDEPSMPNDNVQKNNDITNPFYINNDPIQISHLIQNDPKVVQNIPLSYANNPFKLSEDIDEEEMRQLGTGALNIAQEAAKKIDTVKQHLSENTDNIENTFNDLVDTKDSEKPLIEIGFDQFKHLDGQTKESEMI